MRAAVQELAGFFETSSGLKLVIEYGTVAKVAEKVTGDDPIDVAILTKPFLDELVRAGKMAGGTAAQLARVPIGLAVRQGAPKPDIKTVEAFKKTLLDAKFITYGDPSVGDAAGVHMAKTLETLGLVSETRPKTRLISLPPGQAGHNSSPACSNAAKPKSRWRRLASSWKPRAPRSSDYFRQSCRQATWSSSPVLPGPVDNRSRQRLSSIS